jgi:putative transposase
MNRETLCTGEIYHCYNRGVDKRVIYTSTAEYSYFVHLLYSLNDAGPANNTVRNLARTMHPQRKMPNLENDRDCLVDILAFALMPNHYHLLLRQRVDDGIAKFMQKLGTGYTMYFNEKHSRSGALFQGRYKSVHVDNDGQLLYIPHYIHLNPLDLMGRGSTSTHKNAGEFLMNYKWSSYPDYVGGRAFPSVTERTDVLEMFGGEIRYAKDIKQFISSPKKLLEHVDPGTAMDIDTREHRP